MITRRFFISILVLWLAFGLGCGSALAAYTEFYSQTTGSNLNAGSTTGDAAVYTSAANGGWNSGTGVFTPVSGDPSASGVAVDMWASIYLDAASVTGFVGRVTAVSSTTITVSITAKSGTVPTTSGTGLTCKVGGAWAGPSGAVSFPFGFAAGTMTDSAGNPPCVNLKAGTTYTVSAAMTHSITGPLLVSGYTTTARDGGRATISGGASGSSYIVLTMSANGVFTQDLIFSANGATGTSAGVLLSGTSRFTRCVFLGMRGVGFSASLAGHLAAVACEFAGNNTSNNTGSGGAFIVGQALRCTSHHNAGSNSAGFVAAVGNGTLTRLDGCIAWANGQHGITAITSTGGSVYLTLANCDMYDNAGSGLAISNTGSGFFSLIVESSNFVKNAAYGISAAKSSGTLFGLISNCGYGTGGQANTSGATLLTPGLEETGAVTYASGSTPWNAPTTGDFRIALAAAKGTGLGNFLLTQGGYSGTVGYPDIGSAQHLDTGGSGATGTVKKSRIQTGQ